MTTKMALADWVGLFAELPANVQDYRRAFVRMAVDAGVSTANIALEQVELTAQISN